jgi:hypothetical protein
MDIPPHEQKKSVERAERRAARRRVLPPLPVFVVFVPLLITSVAVSLRVEDLRKVASASSWPVTLGTVLDSRLDGANRTRASTSYIEVDIEYAVGDRIFQARGLRTTGESLSIDRATATRPPVGSTMNLRYDPNSPTRATIVTDWTHDHTLLAIGIAASWLATLIASLFLFPKIRGEVFGRRPSR